MKLTLAEDRHNVLKKLAACGQSCWLDDLSRWMIKEGALSKLVALGVRGVTANPATVAKAITSGTDYDSDIKRAAAANTAASEMYEALVTADIRQACDILRPVYHKSRGEDCYVSLEVSPYLANDTAGSIEEARRLWAAVDRPNPCSSRSPAPTPACRRSRNCCSKASTSTSRCCFRSSAIRPSPTRISPRWSGASAPAGR